MEQQRQRIGHHAPHGSDAVRFLADEDVSTAIEAATQAACHELDEIFPGGNDGGVTSTFVAELQAALQHLLQGRPVVTKALNSAISLPKLALGDDFFGPRVEGNAFLITVAGAGQLALAPDRTTVCLLAQAHDAWDSFDAAVGAGRRYVQAHASTVEEAARFRLRIDPVVRTTQGFALAASAASADSV